MHIPELIRKKRDGDPLSAEEIQAFVQNYAAGRIPDYQASALLMAIFFRGLDDAELECLVDSMMRSGRVLDLGHLPGPKVDKHSTGGVGDKTSLVLAPAAAACGVLVPMISGRGLGFSGGTLDKLESIPGFCVQQPVSRILELLEHYGLALVGQTDELVPADKKLYAIRDVTSTIDSIPLIVASIMSKKLAEGIDALVLDVKTGTGAFMKTAERSLALARAMVATGQRMGKRVTALVTDMNEPLGCCVGNALEVREALETLRGRGPADLTSLCRSLTGHMLHLGGVASSLEDGERRFDEVVASGRALERFQAIIEAQGGDPGVVDEADLLARARSLRELRAERGGFVTRLDAANIGRAALCLGAGRQTADSTIDPAVGIVLARRVGDPVEAGDLLLTIHYNRDQELDLALQLAREAVEIGEQPPPVRQLVKQVIQ